MDPTPLLPFPGASPDADPIDRDLIEIDAAIAMVATGVATRVRLAGLHEPERAAQAGLAHAQTAGVTFALDRDDDGTIGLTLGPRR